MLAILAWSLRPDLRLIVCGFFVSGTTYNSTRHGASVLPVLENLLAINEYMHHAGRELVRFRKRCMVGNGVSVEHDNIGKIPVCQQPAILNLEVPSWQ